MALSPQELSKLKLRLATLKQEGTTSAAPSGFGAAVKDIPSDLSQAFKGASEAVAGAMQKTQDIRGRVEAGETTPLAGTGQTLGAGLRAGAEVVGQGLAAIPKLFTSPETERKVGQAVTSAGQEIAKRPEVQGLVTWYDSLDEEAKRNADAAFGGAEGLATLFGAGPVVKAVKEGLVKPVVGAATSAVSKTKGAAMSTAEATKSLFVPRGKRTVEGTLSQTMEKPRAGNVVTAALEGRAGQEGKLGAFKIEPSKRDIEIANDVLSVSPKNGNVVETLADLRKAIPDISENQIRPFLKANPRTFNTNQIGSRLRSIEMPDLFKTDESLTKTYNLVRERMIESIEKNPHTMEGLWDARKQFDKIVTDQFGDAAFDSEKNTAIKRAIQDMRREVNDYISEQIGDDTFAKQMRKLSNLYEAQYNLAEKFNDLRNTNAINRWIKENPAKAKAAGLGLSAVGVGGVSSLVF